MLDRYLRNIDYIRISITDRCNLRCTYCMPYGEELLDHASILTYEEILRVCKIVSGLGIKKVKITGGEPLVRKDAISLLAGIKGLPGIEQVTVTTNGVLLDQYINELKHIPIDGLNVSLDTLDRKTFQAITGRDEFEKVWNGIQKSILSDIPTKINCVPQKERNEHELLEIAELAVKYPIDVRFIEMMPIGYGKNNKPIQGDEIYKMIADKYKDVIELDKKRGNGPARYITAPSWTGNIGFIDAVTHKFCMGCNRIRLTSTGFLKSCLCYESGVDLREMLRNGSDDNSISKRIKEAIIKKPMEHNFDDLNKGIIIRDTREMYQIGG